MSAHRMARTTTAWSWLLAAALVLMTACASTGAGGGAAADSSSSPGETSARELAQQLGLHLEGFQSDGAARMAAVDGLGIVLFPGTRVANVAGIPYQTLEPIAEGAAGISVSTNDAQAMAVLFEEEHRRVTAETASSAAPRAAPLTLPGPPRPFPGERSASGGQSGKAAAASATGRLIPSAAERSAWGVRLKRRWKWLVIHHSGGDSGNAASFHRHHLRRGWDGLGYHFVIGNGRGSPDGKIEVGYRWTRQQRGAHAGHDAMNDRGIGICLIGNFDKAPPTQRQMDALERLSRFLSSHCDVSSWSVRHHRDVRKTACPGKYFPRDWTFGGKRIRTASR